MIYQSPKDEAQGRALRMLIDRGLKEGEGIQGFVTDIIAELLLALQKYQERAKELKLQLGLTEESHHSDVVAKISELAQARQQAVAEQSETVDILKRGLQNAVIYEEKRCYYRTANGVKMEIPKRYEMPIRVAMETIIRSLTPPPALTKEK